jgi:hypothetical protein
MNQKFLVISERLGNKGWATYVGPGLQGILNLIKRTDEKAYHGIEYIISIDGRGNPEVVRGNGE